MLEFETFFAKQGKKRIAGLDEAGRGPLAGPVTACAVILPDKFNVSGVNDSKQLSESKRVSLFEKIISYPGIEIGIGVVSERVIDKINILEASKNAMIKAIEGLPRMPDHLLIDGLCIDAIRDISQTKIIKGDSRSLSIAAASIIAKVLRDMIMDEYDKELEGYGFAQHKGYGTKIHLDALRKKGVSPIHRMSFAPVSKIDMEINFDERNK